MATYTAKTLSGSTNGRPVAVAATASPGTLLHTAAAAGIDEITLFAANTTAAPIEVTLQLGGISASDGVVASIPAKSGPVAICQGARLQAGVEVRAFAPSAGVNIFGRANNIG